MTPKNKTEVNFILNMRRNRGLGQKQLAGLIGHKHTSMLSKYERGLSLPPLHTALLLEIVLGVRLSELYPNLYQRLTREVATRAKRLSPQVREAFVHRLSGKDPYGNDS
jgi:transcriptional regulator with XRE-family HTH domain